jgi:hypothetical protein
VPLLNGCSDDGGGAGVDASGIDAPPGEAWAAGGTATMTDLASYPDPFTGALAGSALVTATTEGPCTTATDLASPRLASPRRPRAARPALWFARFPRRSLATPAAAPPASRAAGRAVGRNGQPSGPGTSRQPMRPWRRQPVVSSHAVGGEVGNGA